MVNPNKNNWDPPICKLCGYNKCKNCPLPWDDRSLGEFIKSISHPNKFNNNMSLFNNIIENNNLDTDSEEEFKDDNMRGYK